MCCDGVHGTDTSSTISPIMHHNILNKNLIKDHQPIPAVLDEASGANQSIQSAATLIVLPSPTPMVTPLDEANKAYLQCISYDGLTVSIGFVRSPHAKNSRKITISAW